MLSSLNQVFDLCTQVNRDSIKRNHIRYSDNFFNISCHAHMGNEVYCKLQRVAWQPKHARVAFQFLRQKMSCFELKAAKFNNSWNTFRIYDATKSDNLGPYFEI